MEQEPKPTADKETKPITKTVPETTKAIFVLKPKPHRESDQECEPAPTSVEVTILVEYEGMEWSPAYTPASEGELCQVSTLLIDGLENMIPQSLLLPLVPPSSKFFSFFAHLQVCFAIQFLGPTSADSLQSFSSSFVGSTLLPGSAWAAEPVTSPWSVDQLAPSGSSFPPVPPWFSLPPALLQSSGTLAPQGPLVTAALP